MISLRTLNAATAQEVFDQVVNHLLTQNKRSTSFSNKIEVCAYRGTAGRKCAAGCLISDEEYDPLLEGKLWTGVIEHFKPKGLDVYSHTNLIGKLQGIHDCNGDETAWEHKLKALAKEENLKFNWTGSTE